MKNHVATRHQITGKINKESNSYHEFSIKECPLDFHITSRASDGIIESIKHKSLPWEAIMWHPEREIRFQTDDKIRFRISSSEGYYPSGGKRNKVNALHH